ncbi:MAG TPA: N-acetylmuramoyl-L-alanine amidase [Arenicellales bacterium]|nr:N-acetylmuramoyl-L-alanine amidase [Arenicellales bacterium]
MNRLRRQLLLLLLVLSPGPGCADTVIAGLRVWHPPQSTRLVFDLSDPVEFELFDLSDPKRLVVDMRRALVLGTLPESSALGPYLGGIRYGSPKSETLRFVFDLKQSVGYDAFLLPPEGTYGHRLVVDISPLEVEAVDRNRLKPGKRARSFVIVIDPGHGGEDPGATGRRHTREKDVVLAVSKRLSRLINGEIGMQARLTRDRDYYVSLRGRIDIAVREKADLFVSVHADAAKRRSAMGASVYILSNKGATSEIARQLARRENASDLAGGVQLKDREVSVREMILDMEIDWKIRESRDFASAVLKELGMIGPLHSRKVHQAGFVVLKAIEIPAILVEMGYITNDQEEQKLANSLHQERLAAAIFRGIKEYCRQERDCPMVGNSPALYTVKKADSLSLIAARYGFTVQQLRSENALLSDRLQVGQELILPER